MTNESLTFVAEGPSKPKEMVLTSPLWWIFWLLFGVIPFIASLSSDDPDRWFGLLFFGFVTLLFPAGVLYGFLQRLRVSVTQDHLVFDWMLGTRRLLRQQHAFADIQAAFVGYSRASGPFVFLSLRLPMNSATNGLPVGRLVDQEFFSIQLRDRTVQTVVKRAKLVAHPLPGPMSLAGGAGADSGGKIWSAWSYLSRSSKLELEFPIETLWIAPTMNAKQLKEQLATDTPIRVGQKFGLTFVFARQQPTTLFGKNFTENCLIWFWGIVIVMILLGIISNFVTRFI